MMDESILALSSILPDKMILEGLKYQLKKVEEKPESKEEKAMLGMYCLMYASKFATEGMSTDEILKSYKSFKEKNQEEESKLN